MLNSKKLGISGILLLALLVAPVALAAGTESAETFGPVEWLQDLCRSWIEALSSPAPPAPANPTGPVIDANEGGPMIIPSG